jgi:glycosyltransferase involved in cell wall biosynthesis
MPITSGNTSAQGFIQAQLQPQVMPTFSAAQPKAPDASGNVAQIGHILLVTRSYPPLNVVSSLRVYHWAKYWSRQGVRVTVLTTRKHRFFGPCDLDCPPLQNVRVVEVEFLPALVVRLLNRLTGDPATTVGRSQASAGPITLVRVKRWLRRFRQSSKLLPSVEFYDFWITKAARVGRSIVASEQVDALVSSFGPPASHSIAARLKRHFPSLVWVADYRDPWTFHRGYRLRGLNGYLERRRELATVGRHADLLVSVSHGLAEQSKLFLDRPVIVVENGFDPEEEVEAAIDPAGRPEHLCVLWAPTTLVYTGTLHVEYQDPRPLFRAVAKLVASDDRAREQLRVLFFGGRHDRLRPLIEAERIADHVHVVGHVNRYLAMCAQRRASALVLVEDQASAARGYCARRCSSTCKRVDRSLELASSQKPKLDKSSRAQALAKYAAVMLSASRTVSDSWCMATSLTAGVPIRPLSTGSGATIRRAAF